MTLIILLFVAGVCLLIAEFVLPGLIAGIAGVILIIVSTVLAVRAYPDSTAMIIGLEVFGALIGSVVGGVLILQSGLASGLTLSTSQRPEEGWINQPTDTTLIGKIGVVMTALRPAGTIVVEEERIDAVSDGDFIEEGQWARVVEVHGNRVVVERVAVTVDGAPENA